MIASEALFTRLVKSNKFWYVEINSYICNPKIKKATAYKNAGVCNVALTH